MLEPLPPRRGPASPEEILQVIQLSERLLPEVTARPDFEARRLALKSRVPFRIIEDADPSEASV